MTDIHPYPQDITADPFFIFGGLFSRKIIAEELKLFTPKRVPIISEIIQLSRQCSSETQFQQGIEDSFNRFGFSCKKPGPEGSFDRTLGSDCLVEIKLANTNNDPQNWQGSQEKNAVLQTRRYLNDSRNRKWAILTNGQVMRIMHKDSALNFLDIWTCDLDSSGETRHAAFLLKLLSDENYREALLGRTQAERVRFNNSFDRGVREFWDQFKIDGNREWNVGLVESVLAVAFLRYLEDAGIAKTLDEDYHKVGLLNAVTKDQIIERLEYLKEQKQITNTKSHLVDDIVSSDTIARINLTLSKPEIYAKFKNLFWDSSGAVDLSDLSIQFFGDAYQLFANKNDLNGADGQYFTGSDLARETALYFIEDESRNVAIGENEIIYDPFVGSGQLLRALVPYYHLLLQGQLREPSIIAGMRVLASRLRGTDIDKNACWLAKLCLTIVTSEYGKPLMSFKEQIVDVDVFEACYGTTEGQWQARLGIKGTIRAILTNPPWKQLEIHAKQMYSNETGNPIPTEKNRENWRKFQNWKKSGGAERLKAMQEKLAMQRKQHKETYHRVKGTKINVALSAVDFIDRIPGTQHKKWVAFLPDCFFIGKNQIRQRVNLRRYYSFIKNDHFKGADKIMKFGVAFAGGHKSPKVYCHPMGTHKKVDVQPVFSRLGILPVYGSRQEAEVQNLWFKYSKKVTGWSDGEFNKANQKNAGAKETERGIALRGARSSNDEETHQCIFDQSALSYWSDVKLRSLPKSRVIVRDSRPNSTKSKILWSGVHIPGKGGVPKKCLLEDSWNYFFLSQQKAKAYSRILNCPLADIAIRSVAGKRHISPHHLNVLGLPDLTNEQIQLINMGNDYCEYVATIFLLIFKTSGPDTNEILKLCDWLTNSERAKIIELMSLDMAEQANKLMNTKVVVVVVGADEPPPLPEPPP